MCMTKPAEEKTKQYIFKHACVVRKVILVVANDIAEVVVDKVRT